MRLAPVKRQNATNAALKTAPPPRRAPAALPLLFQTLERFGAASSPERRTQSDARAGGVAEPRATCCPAKPALPVPAGKETSDSSSQKEVERAEARPPAQFQPMNDERKVNKAPNKNYPHVRGRIQVVSRAPRSPREKQVPDAGSALNGIGKAATISQRTGTLFN